MRFHVWSNYLVAVRPSLEIHKTYGNFGPMGLMQLGGKLNFKLFKCPENFAMQHSVLGLILNSVLILQITPQVILILFLCL